MSEINGSTTPYMPSTMPLPQEAAAATAQAPIKSVSVGNESTFVDDLLSHLAKSIASKQAGGTQDLDQPRHFTAAQIELLLGKWADKVSKTTSESMLHNIEQQMATVQGGTKSHKAEIKKFFHKQLEQERSQESQKRIGWLITIGTTLAAVATVVAAGAAVAATGGAAAPALVMACISLAAALTDVASKAQQEVHGGKGFSLGQVCAEGMMVCGIPEEQANAYGPAVLGGPAGIVGANVGEVLKALNVDPEVVAIVTAVVTVVASVAMMGAGGSGGAAANAANAADDAARAAQAAKKAADTAKAVQQYAKVAKGMGDVTTATGTVSQGVVQHQSAGITEDLAETQAQIKALESEQTDANEKFDQSLDLLNGQLDTQNKVQSALAQIRRARQQSMQQVVNDIAA